MKCMITFSDAGGVLKIVGCPPPAGPLRTELGRVYPRTHPFTGGVADLHAHMRKVNVYKDVSFADLEALVRSIIGKDHELHFRSVNDVQTFTFDRVEVS